jgi:hypothetical protein
MAKNNLSKHQSTLLIASALALLVWSLPIARWLVVPLIYLNTILHEISHAVVTLATGGQVAQIRIFADGSGVTLTQGGWLVFITAAGYIGATLMGGAMVYFARTPVGARRVLTTLACVVGGALVLWIRGDAVGMVAAITWTLGLGLAAANLSDDGARTLAQFLGIAQCLASAQAFLVLLQLTASANVQNDAGILAQRTFIPATVWALAWALLSLVVLVVTLRHAWK